MERVALVILQYYSIFYTKTFFPNSFDIVAFYTKTFIQKYTYLYITIFYTKTLFHDCFDIVVWIELF